MTEKLDKDGNPIKEGDEVTLTPEEELEKVKAENATLLQTKETLVNEIQDLRKKKQLTEEERETLASKIAELEKSKDENEPDVLEKVVEMLNKNKQDTIKKNKEKAMNKFLASHPELSPSNDEAGLKKAAFDRKLAMFNTSDLEDETDFLTVFDDTYKLLGFKEVEVEDTNTVTNTPGSTGKPKTEDENKLTPQEIDYVNKHFRGKVERYLELKTKYPEIVKNLQ